MSAATTSRTRTRTRVFLHAVRAEASKLCSLPATWLTLTGTLALTIALAIAFATTAREGRESMVTALSVGLVPLTYAQIGFFLLGVIAACSEHVGGQARTTLTAIPNRITQRLTATLALIPLAVAAAIVISTVGITVTNAVLGETRGAFDVSLAASSIIKASAYLAAMTVLSSAFGTLVRRAIPAAGVLLVYLLVISPLLLGQRIGYLLPDIAGYTLWYPPPPADAPSPPIAWITVIGWTLALLIPSIITAARRDT